MREKIKYEQKVRKDLRDALTCNESDRKFLLQELARREEVLDELAAAKHGKPGHKVMQLILSPPQLSIKINCSLLAHLSLT